MKYLILITALLALNAHADFADQPEHMFACFDQGGKFIMGLTVEDKANKSGTVILPTEQVIPTGYLTVGTEQHWIFQDGSQKAIFRMPNGNTAYMKLDKNGENGKVLDTWKCFPSTDIGAQPAR
jgi:hypothetical protein